MSAMASQYDTETKAQALALLELGKPASHVAQEMSIPERTVSRWAGRWRQMAAKEGDKILTDEDYRLAVRAGELMHDALDQMEDRDDLYKYLVPLNITRGTAIDKILKRQELQEKSRQTEAGQALADAINRLADLSVPQLHDVIEGELVE